MPCQDHPSASAMPIGAPSTEAALNAIMTVLMARPSCAAGMTLGSAPSAVVR
ncbi:hypothetical protein OMP38_31205 [Cohnella ginsengisoli]|uniref:Uncharacterized protein n=1 Tax=Cohnella ginsengisoli TaxID=425004 RepID=A0A9X4KNQ9_9BACL|nr:hypothetical protein [Cohnella ginsengisoli]MDG0794799.1 hypothetical protein [Cohnella ginsengisoli]